MTGTLGTKRDTIGNQYLDFINYYSDYCFFAKLNGNGDCQWACKFGSGVFGVGPIPSAISVKNNRVYITASAVSNSGAKFILEGGPTLLGMDAIDYFLGAYDTSGNYKWSNVSNALGDEALSGLAVDSNENVVGAGRFDYNLNIPNDTIWYDKHGSNSLLVAYDSNGVLQYAASAGGASIDFGSSIAVSANGAVHVTGSLSCSSCYFGNDTLIASSAGSHIWVSSIDSVLVRQTPNGINDATLPNHYSLFPNPATNNIVLQFGNEVQNGALNITNQMGQSLFNASFTTINRQYLQHLPLLVVGLYFITVNYQNHSITRKLIIQ